MKANAVRFAAGLALVAFGAPLPASGQYFPPAADHRPAAGAGIRHAEARSQSAPPPIRSHQPTRPRRPSRRGTIKGGHTCRIKSRR